jgi:hypothetical protein
MLTSSTLPDLTTAPAIIGVVIAKNAAAAIMVFRFTFMMFSKFSKYLTGVNLFDLVIGCQKKQKGLEIIDDLNECSDKFEVAEMK